MGTDSRLCFDSNAGRRVCILQSPRAVRSFGSAVVGTEARDGAGSSESRDRGRAVARLRSSSRGSDTVSEVVTCLTSTSRTPSHGQAAPSSLDPDQASKPPCQPRRERTDDVGQREGSGDGREGQEGAGEGRTQRSAKQVDERAIRSACVQFSKISFENLYGELEEKARVSMGYYK